jgi:hypothetical protein
MTEAAGTLQVGQVVVVREHRTFGVVVAVVPAGEPGLEVVEVGTDCLVLAESATGTRTRIPWYLVNVDPGAQPRTPQSGEPALSAAPRLSPVVGAPDDRSASDGRQPDAIPA